MFFTKGHVHGLPEVVVHDEAVAVVVAGALAYLAERQLHLALAHAQDGRAYFIREALQSAPEYKSPVFMRLFASFPQEG